MKPFPLVLLLILFAGCTLTHSAIQHSGGIDPRYEQLYPQYVEVCAMSQFRPKGAEPGGRHGHAVLYLHGACRKERSAYPSIELCPEGDHSGIGISVNKMFKNVNWVAVPGRDFFMRGTLDEQALLDEEQREETIRQALEMEIFRNIQVHEEYLYEKTEDVSVEAFIAKKSAGTDYALNFGRSVICSRVPVTQPMLEDTVGFLNDLNEKYVYGDDPYDWSGYHDNCAHTVHNALAAAGIWKSKSVDEIKILQFFNLAIPANEFIYLAERTQDKMINAFGSIYRDASLRKSLVDDGWLPMRHGALIQTIPVHSNNNLYDQEVRIFVLQTPYLHLKSNKIHAMLNTAHKTNLQANLLYYREAYEAVLVKKPSGLEKDVAKSNYDEVRFRYYQYIEAKLEEVQVKLNELAGPV